MDRKLKEAAGRVVAAFDDEDARITPLDQIPEDLREPWDALMALGRVLKEHEFRTQYVLMIEEPTVAPLAPGWGQEGNFAMREIGWFDDEDHAMDAGIGIISNKLAQAKYGGRPGGPKDYYGAALVFAESDRREDGTFDRRDERQGVDASELDDLAKVWIP